MPASRLLALVMSIALCTGFALGQSQQNNSSDLVVFQGAASLSSSIDLTQSKVNLESKIAEGQSKMEYNGLLADARDQWGNSHDLSQGLPLGPDADRTCYFIRDYVVIRESAHSDATHRDGSFTCVPGSRFRVYTTAAQGVKVER